MSRRVTAGERSLPVLTDVEITAFASTAARTGFSLAPLDRGDPVRVPLGMLPDRVRALIGRWRTCLIYPDGTVVPN